MKDLPSSQKTRWKKFFGKRILLGLGFTLLLTVFLHFREMPIENLEKSAKAERFVISQLEFEFPDEESTQILKQESLRDIGSIFRIDEKEVQLRRAEFENLIRENQSWREELKESPFEDLHNAADAIETALLRSRFTDPRTLGKMDELFQPTLYYSVLSLDDVHKAVHFSEEFWEKIRAVTFPDRELSSESISYTLQFFEKRLWKLEFDRASERILRQVIEESIPLVYTHVESGSRIIQPGERVTSRHIAMLKAMKQAMGEARDFWAPLTMCGSIILAILFSCLGFIYLRFFHKQILRSFQKLSLLVSILGLTMVLAKAVEFLFQNKEMKVIDLADYPLFVPFATILICSLVGSEVALMASAFLAIVLQMALAIDTEHFLVINLIAALVTLVAARGIHKRKEIFSVCIKVWGCSLPVIFGFHFTQNHFFTTPLLLDAASSFIFMTATALLVLAVLPLFESGFHVMTDMTLMEYMDPNNELLRRLSLEAPGSYQHSLVIGNLSETAALAINANGLFCRVSTLYHDIGKLSNAHYFTENQLGGFNMHQLLTPQESAQVIIAHIAEGEALARKHRLPQSFIDIIREHHGTTLVYYFYCKQRELICGELLKIEEKKFRYPGPKPRSKESAIIMIADSVEATARSMEEVTEESLTAMIDRIVAEKIDDGQLDDSHLTFEELGTVKKSMVKTLCVARHLRIKYPEKTAAVPEELKIRSLSAESL